MNSASARVWGSTRSSRAGGTRAPMTAPSDPAPAPLWDCGWTTSIVGQTAHRSTS